MKQNTTRKFNEDFKKMVADLYRSGQSVKQLSSEYGISDVTIYYTHKDHTFFNRMQKTALSLCPNYLHKA